MEAFICGGVSVLFDDPPELRASSDSGQGGAGNNKSRGPFLSRHVSLGRYLPAVFVGERWDLR